MTCSTRRVTPPARRVTPSVMPRRLLALAAAFVAAIALPAAAPGRAAAATCDADGAGRAGDAASAPRVVALVTPPRASARLAPLAVSPALSKGATWKARHMAAFGYMAHDDPTPVPQT